MTNFDAAHPVQAIGKPVAQRYDQFHTHKPDHRFLALICHRRKTMQRKFHIFWLLPILVLLLGLACNFSASTASIKNAVMTLDEAGSQPANGVFSTTQPFFCQVELANAPDDTKVKAAWTAVDVEGADANTAIDETEVESGGTVTFRLDNEGPWPVGKYKVDLYLNDKLDRTLEFEVKE
jgi:hypothetical protein